ncbi:MAG: DUF2892 domain-containing protein [Desulfobacterales bacterium]|nr:DUF2892 domain-containing protein [Desulfobacterales bacterium]
MFIIFTARKLLAGWHHPYWVWFTVFIGLNLIQSSLTGFCPVVFVFRKLGIKQGNAASFTFRLTH